MNKKLFCFFCFFVFCCCFNVGKAYFPDEAGRLACQRFWLSQAARYNILKHPLHFAAQTGDVKRVIELVNTYKLDVNSLNSRNDSALILAIMFGQINVIAALLALGADPSISGHNCNDSYVKASNKIFYDELILKLIFYEILARDIVFKQTYADAFAFFLDRGFVQKSLKRSPFYNELYNYFDRIMNCIDNGVSSYLKQNKLEELSKKRFYLLLTRIILPKLFPFNKKNKCFYITCPVMDKMEIECIIQ